MHFGHGERENRILGKGQWRKRMKDDEMVGRCRKSVAEEVLIEKNGWLSAVKRL